MTQVRVSEKVEQQHVVKLIVSVGGRAYALGTRRKKPPKGMVLETREQKREWFSTRQTPGIGDVLGFLPPRGVNTSWLQVWIELKARDGRLSTDQQEFRRLCIASNTAHVVGGLNAVIAWLIDQHYLKRENVPHYRLPAAARTTSR